MTDASNRAPAATSAAKDWLAYNDTALAACKVTFARTTNPAAALEFAFANYAPALAVVEASLDAIADALADA